MFIEFSPQFSNFHNRFDFNGFISDITKEAIAVTLTTCNIFYQKGMIDDSHYAIQTTPRGPPRGGSIEKFTNDTSNSHEFMKDLILPKFADSLCEFGFDGGLLYF